MYKKFDKKIDALLSKMTLEEKIGQLNQIMTPTTPEKIEKVKEDIRNGRVGSFIMALSATAGNGDTLKLDNDFFNEFQRIAVEESPNHIPLIYGRDVIHGHHNTFPIPLAMAASFNPDMVTKSYRDIAEEAVTDGIQWTFAPMLDLSRDPRWGRLIEGPGEDPYVAVQMAKAVVKGLQNDDLTKEDSLVACAKHFIGYGASESGRDYHRTEISDYSLFNNYLPAFKAAVDAGVGTVMSSFNDINGYHINATDKYLKGILRERLGFEGFVISDWDVPKRLMRYRAAKDAKDATKKSILSGLDMDMVDELYINNLKELVESGEVEESLIDESVRRVLRIKFAKGLFENPYCGGKAYDNERHIEDTRKMASEGMVLLKNDGVLPLSKQSKIVLQGPFKNETRALLGSWILDFKTEGISFAEALANVLPNGNLYNHPQECGVWNNINLYMHNADAIVLALGESHAATGERRCVADISLDNSQIELIRAAKATGKKVVGVFFCGRPMALEGVVDMLDAAVYAWHSGSETANAVCDILFGDVVPSGKLPITFPRKTGHIPSYYNVTGSGSVYYGDVDNMYVDGPSTPYFPFGYGLSYTEFKYSPVKTQVEKISLEDLRNGKKIVVGCDVSNIGNVDAKETVQLYIRAMFACPLRPLRELKGFEKALIKAGETKTFTFTLGFDDLAYYTPDGILDLAEGEYEIYIGGNCLTDNKIKIDIE